MHTFEGEKPRNSIKHLPYTIKSLVGLNSDITPSWFQSVCHIIKDLKTSKLVDDEKMKNAMLKKIETRPSSSINSENDIHVSKIQGELVFRSAQLQQLSIQRKQALEDFLDLKGNIRVLCRVRPFLPNEKPSCLKSVLTPNSNNLSLKFGPQKSKHYSFDKVFHPQSTQDEVFSEIEPVIKSALDGYNVCIFAYGQTGTGKTYTMEGSLHNPGVVPRGIDILFKYASENNYKFKFRFSMLEIYKGNLRDLLSQGSTKQNIQKFPCLSIQMNQNGDIQINNLVAVNVNMAEQVMRLYQHGGQLRSTASTNSNSVSSRSHCLICISISCYGETKRQRETNKIWMVDLGGSERLLKTKATGRRLEEGRAINLSLSALGDVISALQQKRKHVPYRNSKLTQILRDSLGPDSKSLMLVHVSPREEDLCETVCSLGFASRVRSIHLGNEDPPEVKVKRENQMARLQQKVKELETEEQEIQREIQSLNTRLRYLSPEPIDEAHFNLQTAFTKELHPDEQVDLQSINSFRDQRTNLPRFMRPTICSRQRTDSAQQPHRSIIKQPPDVPKKRRCMSVSAEPVTSKEKNGDWESEGSEYRMSTATYAYHAHANDETDWSQGASEYDIKEIIFLKEEKSPRSSTTPPSHGSINELEGIQAQSCRNMNTSSENWFHPQLAEQTSIYNNCGKRVFAIPSNTSNRCDTHNSEPKCDQEENPAAEATILNSAIENYKGNRTHCQMMEVAESDSVCFCSHSGMQDMQFNQKGNPHLITEVRLTSENQKGCIGIANEADGSTALCMIQTEIPQCIESTQRLRIYNKKYLAFQQQKDAEKSCLGYRCNLPLCMAADQCAVDQMTASEDSLLSSIKLQDKIQGKHWMFLKPLQIFWRSALLGLGVHSLGLDCDFFNALLF